MTNVTALSTIAALRGIGSGGGSAAPIIWVEGYAAAADGGEGMFVYVSSDTSSLDNGGTIIVVTGQTYRYYREYSKAPLNVCWFGAFINSSTDSSTALNKALAALPAGGGTIYFPAGTFTFSSAISYTASSSQDEFSLSLVGDGADDSILYWPGETNGIAVTLTVTTQSVHFRDMSITTGQECNYFGVLITQTGANGVATGQSDFTRINFRGAEPQLQYWAYGISATNISNINYIGLMIVGSLPENDSGGGVTIQGTASAGSYALVHNFTDCIFYSGSVGILYGTFVQGVTVSQSNFGTNIGISLPSAGAGQAQLAVTSSQFGCNTYGIAMESPIGGVSLLGNSFYFPTDATSYAAIYINHSTTVNLQGLAIQGNIFSGTAIDGSAGKGIVTVGSSNIYGLVSGNIFENMAVGVDLTGAYLWNVQGNIYSVTIPTKVIHGTGNSVGIATD